MDLLQLILPVGTKHREDIKLELHLLPLEEDLRRVDLLRDLVLLRDLLLLLLRDLLLLLLPRLKLRLGDFFLSVSDNNLSVSDLALAPTMESCRH